MARCERQKPKNQGFVVYKRHRFVDGKCTACGMRQTNIYPKPKRK